MYYLTYKNFETGFVFNEAKPRKRVTIGAVNQLFDTFGNEPMAQVLVTEGDATVIDRYNPPPK